MKKQYIGKIAGLLAVTAIWASTNANAAFTWYTGSAYNPASSQTLQARVGFEVVGTTLTVRLENLGGPSTVNSDVLTAVMFNLGAGIALDAQVGGMTIGGFDYAAGTPAQQAAQLAAVGDNWSYQSGLTMPSGRFTGANAGISSTGLGIFNSGGGDRFGLNLDSYNLNGPSWGIAQAPVGANSDPFVLDWAQYTLAITAGSIDPTKMGPVYFQWGTALNEPGSDNTTPVPEPSTVVAGALLLLPFGASIIRIVRKNRTA